MNNFQRMMAEEERRTPPPPPRIKQNVGGTIRIYRFLGHIVELYLPRVVDLFVLLSGGENETETGKHPASNRTGTSRKAPAPKKH